MRRRKPRSRGGKVIKVDVVILTSGPSADDPRITSAAVMIDGLTGTGASHKDATDRWDASAGRDLAIGRALDDAARQLKRRGHARVQWQDRQRRLQAHAGPTLRELQAAYPRTDPHTNYAVHSGRVEWHPFPGKDHDSFRPHIHEAGSVSYVTSLPGSVSAGPGSAA